MGLDFLSRTPVPNPGGVVGSRTVEDEVYQSLCVRLFGSRCPNLRVCRCVRVTGCLWVNVHCSEVYVRVYMCEQVCPRVCE